jgi:hypothetical protein
MRRMRKRIIDIRARIAWAVLRLVFSLPDRGVSRLARWTHDAVYPFVRDPESEGLLRLREVEEIFLAGPPWSDVIRRFILSGRKAQGLAIVRGMLRHLGGKDKD